jgi:hypothetical protein
MVKGSFDGASQIYGVQKPDHSNRAPTAPDTPDKPSGVRQAHGRGAALWRWLVCNLSGSHVSRRVVSASASSSPSRVRTHPLETELQTPTALLGRIPCGAARVGGVVLCPEWVPVATGTFCLLRAPLDGRGRKFNSPAKAAELMRAEPRSEDAARRRTSTP